MTQEQAKMTLADVESIIKIHEGENCFVVQFGEALIASQTAMRKALTETVWSQGEVSFEGKPIHMTHCAACSRQWWSHEEEKHSDWCWVPEARAALLKEVETT